MPDTPGTSRDTKRMEAFSDAVFAIAITLPIVEIEMPQLHGTPGLGAELARLWPSYLGYLLSFLVIGIYWTHHHFSGKIYARADHGFLLATLVFLMMIAFIAFPTRVLAEHIADAANRPAAARFYVLGLLLTALAWLVKWLSGLWGGSLDERLDPAYVRRLTWQYSVSTGVYVAAALLSLASPLAGLALAAAVTLYYLRRPPDPVYRAGREGPE
jgi:uncharacterized membrane protein